MLQSNTGIEIGDGEMVTEKVWVTCGNDGVGEKESGCSMIGVEAVALPWVVAQHHIGLHNANESH